MCVLSPINYSESRPDIGDLYERSRSTTSPKKWSPLSPLCAHGFNYSPFNESNANLIHDVWASPNTTSFTINSPSTWCRSPSPAEQKRRTSKVPLEAPNAPRMKPIQLPSPTEIENDQKLASRRTSYSIVKPRRVSNSSSVDSASCR